MVLLCITYPLTQVKNYYYLYAGIQTPRLRSPISSQQEGKKGKKKKLAVAAKMPMLHQQIVLLGY